MNLSAVSVSIQCATCGTVWSAPKNDANVLRAVEKFREHKRKHPDHRADITDVRKPSAPEPPITLTDSTGRVLTLDPRQ